MAQSAAGLDPKAEPSGADRKAPASRTASRFAIGLAIVLAYAALACLTTWPLVTQLRTHLPGDSTDALLHYWNGWWVQRALGDGQSPFFTPYLFYPNGLSLVTHNMAWFQILPWLIFEPLIGGIAAYNLGILINLTLCGCAAFVLTYHLTGDARAAFLGGLIYQAWPYRLSQLDHPNMLATYWVPVFFLFLVRTLQAPQERRTGGWRDSILAGLCFALVGYTRWQQLIPVTLMALVYFVCSAPDWWPRGRRHILLRLVVAAAVAALVLLPPALLLFSRQTGEGGAVNLLRAEEDEQMQTDVLAYLTPWDAHPLFGRVTGSLYERYYGDRPYAPNPAYVGLVAVVLAALGVYTRRWKSLGWVAMAVVLILVALGPILRVGGRLFHVPTLYGLLAPLVRLMRVPERFNVFVALPVSVLAAYGVAGLLARRPALTRWPGVSILVLLGGLIVFESLGVPVPLIDVSNIPAFYAHIAEEPGQFALLNVPSRNSKDYMFEQTYHQRPILRGNISRLPTEATAYVDKHPRLGFLADPHNLPPKEGVGGLLAALAQEDIRYVVLHKARLGEDGVARWRRYMLVEPRYEDERVLVYVTTPEAGRDVVMQELAPGLGPVQVLPATSCAPPGGVVELAVGWASTQAQEHVQEHTWDVLLSLADASGQVRQVIRYPLSETRPTSQWPPGALVWEVYAVRLAPTLADGQYAVRLGLSQPLDEQTSDPAQPEGGRWLPVGTVDVQQEPCHLAVRPEARDVNARFGDGLYLTEYNLAHEAAVDALSAREAPRLDLTLYWRPTYRPESDYKVFVHVYDPATGIPVAQHDGMPRNWTYPMTRWWPGEVVADPIFIPLQGVPAGRYHIGVGVYDPATGERLPLVDGEGREIEDGRLVLDEVVEVK